MIRTRSPEVWRPCLTCGMSWADCYEEGKDACCTACDHRAPPAPVAAAVSGDAETIDGTDIAGWRRLALDANAAACKSMDEVDELRGRLGAALSEVASLRRSLADAEAKVAAVTADLPVAMGSFEEHQDGCPFGDGVGTTCTCEG